MAYIEREAAIAKCREIAACEWNHRMSPVSWADAYEQFAEDLEELPAADVAQVRHGRWILEAHDERVNYRWNVTAECSECCDEQKEIWAGFFPNVPPSIARGAAMASAESVKLSNYCPNCGAKMDGD